MTAKFCLRCGEELKLQDVCGELRPSCPACRWTHYEDPKVATGCLIFNQRSEVLLVRRAIEPIGLWTFPGGYVDRYEDPVSSALREVSEETGMSIQITSLLDIYRAPQSPVLLIVYLAKPTLDSPGPSALHECDDIGYFQLGEIPWDKLAFETTTRALKDGFRKKLASVHQMDNFS